MTLIRFFPLAVAILELAACLVYVFYREWRMAIIWAGYALAAFAFSGDPLMPPVVQIQVQRAPGDCSICALSMYLGTSYENVLGAAVSITKRSRVHHVGMFTREMKQTAAKLWIALTLKRAIDLDTDEGVLAVTDADQQQHAVLLKAGLIFDGDGTVWEPETFMAHYHYRPVSLLVRDED